MASQDISRSTNTRVLVASLCVAFVFVLLRCGARWFKTRRIPLALEDVFMYVALCSFAIMVALYLATMPTFYNVQAIIAGQMAPYESLAADLVGMLKEFFAVQIFFWLTLWAVKWSLLFMFKKLTDGIPLYTLLWKGVFAFTVLTFIGCVISGFTSCSSMDAWFSAGSCLTDRDARAKAISLWYCLAVDVLTDLMIMAIPLRVLFTLHISLVEKLSIAVVFTVGIVTMVCAIVRSVSLNSSVEGGQVSTTWLMLWAGIEGVVAIIVGCLPAFAIFIRGRVEASRVRSGPYTANSSSNGPVPLTHLRNSRAKSAARRESVLLGEGWPLDDGSRKSLVGVDVVQGWRREERGKEGGIAG